MRTAAELIHADRQHRIHPLHHDIVSFAKGVASGYLPPGGILVNITEEEMDRLVDAARDSQMAAAGALC